MTLRTISIDRKAASKILRVSVRTIDRYIRRGLLNAHTENGRIWLDKKEIATFSRGDKESVPVTIVKRPRAPVSTLTRPLQENLHDAAFYRDLYTEAHKVIADYQQKLEQSNYRIGQLESQIIHPTGHLPLERTSRESSYATEMLNQDLRNREKEIDVLKHALKNERTARIIFAVITYALLIVQPIFWYLLR